MSRNSNNRNNTAAAAPAPAQTPTDTAPPADTATETPSDETITQTESTADQTQPPEEAIPAVEEPAVASTEDVEAGLPPEVDADADEPTAEGEAVVLVTDLEQVVEEKQSRAVTVTGIQYASVEEAALALSIPVEAMLARLGADNEEYASYQYVGETE